MSTKPIIGLTVDHQQTDAGVGRYQSSELYSRAVIAAGGVPVLLVPDVVLISEYVTLCDGVIFTGGADVRMEEFGQATHPAAKPISPERQAFDLALLRALDAAAEPKPILGICLGMQLMALAAGGMLDQHLPDKLGTAAAQHQDNQHHAVQVDQIPSKLGGPRAAGSKPPGATVVSSHHQAVSNPGRLRVIAHALDGVIEAVDDPTRPFHVGVQWHPERGGNDELNLGLIARFVAACRGRS